MTKKKKQPADPAWKHLLTSIHSLKRSLKRGTSADKAFEELTQSVDDYAKAAGL